MAARDARARFLPRVKAHWGAWLIALLVVLLVAHAVASWLAGRVAQRAIEDWVAQLAAAQAEGPDAQAEPPVTLDAYHRGIYTSSIDFTLRLRDARGAWRALPVHDALQHGPWPWRAVLDGHWRVLAGASRLRPREAPAWRAWFDAVRPEHAIPWVLDARLRFDGHVQGELHLAAVHAATLAFAGGWLQFDHDPVDGAWSFSGRAPALRWHDPDESLVLQWQGLKLGGRAQGTAPTTWQAHQTLEFEQLQLDDGGAPAQSVRLQNPRLGLDLARSGALLDGRLQLGAEGFSAAGHEDFGTLDAQAVVQSLNLPALDAALRGLEPVVRGHPDGAPWTPEQQAQMRALLAPVLATAPQVALDWLRWRTANGQSELRAQLQLQPLPDGGPAELDAALVQGVREGRAHLRLSKPMLLDVLRTAGVVEGDVAEALYAMLFDRFVDRWVRAGVVQRTGANVQADVRYVDGALRINGQPLPADLLPPWPAVRW